MVSVVVWLTLAFAIVLILGLVVWSILSWKIPVIVLRYQGDKRRPLIHVTRARKMYKAGVWRLQVRGFKLPMRDFKSSYYYPSKKGKDGALLLWEYKTGYLTPLVPQLKGLSRKQKKEVNRALREFEHRVEGVGLSGVDFLHDDELYRSLLVKAVDDTDIDWMLQEISRADAQYTIGWRDFLAKHATHIVLMILIICLLTGWIIYLDKAPDIAKQCLDTGKETATNFLESYAGSLGVERPPA